MIDTTGSMMPPYREPWIITDGDDYQPDPEQDERIKSILDALASGETFIITFFEIVVESDEIGPKTP